MHKSIAKLLENSLDQARRFLEDSIIEVNGLFGFPEFKGKPRITEWGGTSSALSALTLLDNINPSLKKDVESSKRWLINQNRNGSWNASGYYSLEATAGVLNDVYILNIVPREVVDQALKYFWDNYSAGFFMTPGSKDNPHVYTTYLILKCFTHYSNIPLGIKGEIKKWLLSVKTHDNKWGISKGSEASVAHSIYALYILNYCGDDWNTITNDYKELIQWILGNFSRINYVYEEFETIIHASDPEGHSFLRLRISHYILPLVGNLCIDMNLKVPSIRIFKEIVNTQRNGGWGPDSRLTMWATYQAIAFLVRFDNHISKKIRILDILKAYYSFIAIRILVSLIAIGLFIWIITDYNNGISFVISFAANCLFFILPWLIQKRA